MAAPAVALVARAAGPRLVKTVLALAALVLVGFFGAVVGLTALVSSLFGSGSSALSLGPPTNLGVVSPPGAIVALDEQVAAASPPLVACQVPAAILLAQQYVESGYNPSATSPAGAEGLAQFEPGTWPAYALPVPPGGTTPPTPWNPTDAAWAEARFLCSHGFASTPTGALVAYNCGSTSFACRAVSGRYASEILGLAQRIAPPAPTGLSTTPAPSSPPAKGPSS
jgi:hypothetical protein